MIKRTMVLTVFFSLLFSCSGFANSLDEWNQWHTSVVNDNWTISSPMTSDRFASWSPESTGSNHLVVEVDSGLTFRKKSLCIVLTARTVVTGATSGSLSIKINDTQLNPITLSSGHYADTGWKKELLIHHDLITEDISNGHGSDTIEFVASGDISISLKKLIYGDYSFGSIHGTITPTNGTPWALRTATFHFLTDDGPLPSRDMDFIIHSHDLAQPNHFEYAFTTLDAEVPITEFRVEVPGYETNNHYTNLTFPPYTTTVCDFSVSVRNWCKPLAAIHRPCSSIPLILKHGKGPKGSATFKIELDLPISGSSIGNFSAALKSDYMRIPLTIVKSTSGENAIYNDSKPGWSLLAKLTGEWPEDLYDLHVRWVQDGALKRDLTVRSVKIIDDYFIPQYFGNPVVDVDYFFTHITDSHLWRNDLDLADCIEMMNVVNPSFIIATGDIVDQGGLEWAYNATLLQDTLKELRVPFYMCPGNHEYGTAGNPEAENYSRPLRELVLSGYDYYHGQSLYNFQYGGHHYFSADDGLYCEEAGYIDEDLASDYIHIEDLAWLDNQFYDLLFQDTFVCTFSHKYGKCQDPPFPYAWSDSAYFDYVVNMHISGHCHVWGACLDPKEYTPGTWLGARGPGYRDAELGLHAMHYIDDNAPVTKKYSHLWDQQGFLKKNSVTVNIFGGGHQKTATLTNLSGWEIPEARVRFRFNNVNESEQWGITHHDAPAARIAQSFYSNINPNYKIAVVDCDVFLGARQKGAEPVVVNITVSDISN